MKKNIIYTVILSVLLGNVSSTITPARPLLPLNEAAFNYIKQADIDAVSKKLSLNPTSVKKIKDLMGNITYSEFKAALANPKTEKDRVLKAIFSGIYKI